MNNFKFFLWFGKLDDFSNFSAFFLEFTLLKKEICKISHFFLECQVMKIQGRGKKKKKPVRVFNRQN
jgi:hypothetical protein